MFSPATPTRTTTAPWRAKVRRAVDLVVAFATLEDVPHDHADAPATQHHHPRRLRAATPARRPGTTPSRHHACMSPLPRPASRPRATSHH